MAYFLPLLLYVGIGGGVLLLGINSVARFRSLQKPVAAVLMTALTLAWAAAPVMGKWMLSVWAPISVAGGWLVLDLTPAIWWGVLMTGAAVSGVLWIDVAERRVDLTFGGTLLLLLFTVIWSALSAGSLLMTLALWAIFDIVWVVVRLVASLEGERVVWAAAVQGLTSLLLWTISLFLLREGTSGIWWLMRPSDPVLTLMYIAGLMRLGFYPFQVVNTETLNRSHPLSLMSMVNPLMGIALLYRLISLPGVSAVPVWVLVWGALSFLWLGIRAFSLQGRQALVVASQAVLLVIATGAMALGDAGLLMLGTGTWIACLALLIASKRFERWEFYMIWPAAIAVCFLIGAPLSPLLPLYRGVFDVLGWPWRVVVVLGLATTATALLRGIGERARGRVLPPRLYLTLSALAGLVLILGAMVGSVRQVGMSFGSVVSLLLWAFALVLAFVLLRWGRVAQRVLDRGRPLVDLLDLQWFYSAVWEGAENLLGVLRATAEVVEGSGSVLWSLLILLLVLMVLGRR